MAYWKISNMITLFVPSETTWIIAEQSSSWLFLYNILLYMERERLQDNQQKKANT